MSKPLSILHLRSLDARRRHPAVVTLRPYAPGAATSVPARALPIGRGSIEAVTSGPLWARMNAQPRRSAAALLQSDVPTTPGVYVWYRDGEPLYAGRAVGRAGLQERIWGDHLRTGHDLSRSSFRRIVCDHLGIAPTSRTTLRPTLMTAAEVEPLNRWIRECEVAWVECNSPKEAERLEKMLRAEWMAPLSRG
jgi:hypothetical protein